MTFTFLENTVYSLPVFQITWFQFVLVSSFISIVNVVFIQQFNVVKTAVNGVVKKDV